MFLFVWGFSFSFFWMHLARVCIIGLVRGHLFLLGKRRVYFFDPWGRRVCNLFLIVIGFCTKIAPRRRRLGRARREGGSEKLHELCGRSRLRGAWGKGRSAAPPPSDPLRMTASGCQGSGTESPGRASLEEQPAPKTHPLGAQD